MKLGKLLGAGKSFFGWQGSVAYRKNKHVYLPKFNSGTNPFGVRPAEPQPAPAPSAPELPMTPVPAPAAVKTPELPVAPKLLPKPSPFSAPVVIYNPAPAVKPVVAVPARTPNWAEKLIPFRGSKPAKPAPVPMPNVQPEFSLNAVKVVHNDLSDADVEVVPMKSRPAAPATTTVKPMDFLGEPVLKNL